MSIVEITSSIKGKCIGCEYYTYFNRNWLSGECINDDTKAQKKPRYFNDKTCIYFKRKKNERSN